MESEPAARYCARGHRNAAEARFCIACGDPLYTSAPMPPPEPRPLYPERAAQPEPPGQSQGASPQQQPPSSPATPSPAQQAGTSQPSAEPAAPPTWPHSALSQPPAVVVARGRKWAPILILVGLLIAVGVGAVAFFGVGSGPELRGLYVLFDADGGIEGTWDDCEGSGGYSDFGSGMNISIRGRDDEIVGSGEVVSLTEDLLPEIVEMDWASEKLVGLDENEDRDAAVRELRNMLRSSEGIGCWLFIRADLENSDYYSIEVGDRGDINYSREDLAEDNYIISISLGM